MPAPTPRWTSHRRSVGPLLTAVADSARAHRLATSSTLALAAALLMTLGGCARAGLAELPFIEDPNAGADAGSDGGAGADVASGGDTVGGDAGVTSDLVACDAATPCAAGFCAIPFPTVTAGFCTVACEVDAQCPGDWTCDSVDSGTSERWCAPLNLCVTGTRDQVERPLSATISSVIWDASAPSTVPSLTTDTAGVLTTTDSGLAHLRLVPGDDNSVLELLPVQPDLLIGRPRSYGLPSGVPEPRSFDAVTAGNAIAVGWCGRGTAGYALIDSATLELITVQQLAGVPEAGCASPVAMAGMDGSFVLVLDITSADGKDDLELYRFSVEQPVAVLESTFDLPVQQPLFPSVALSPDFGALLLWNESGPNSPRIGGQLATTNGVADITRSQGRSADLRPIALWNGNASDDPPAWSALVESRLDARGSTALERVVVESGAFGDVEALLPVDPGLTLFDSSRAIVSRGGLVVAVLDLLASSGAVANPGVRLQSPAGAERRIDLALEMNGEGLDLAAWRWGAVVRVASGETLQFVAAYPRCRPTR